MAEASCNSSNTKSDTRVTRDPSIIPPERFERVKKPVGSKKLVLGKWVTVKRKDEDAIK